VIQRPKLTQSKPVKIPTCKECLGLGHTAWQCPQKKRKPLQSRKGLVSKKPMRKVGKVGKPQSSAENTQGRSSVFTVGF
jgi:hypothetical protein